jgi:(R,R)-butanediol dehydrogenase/meso-butanediol dehydrogenase/diacetyl reductase
MRYVSVDAPRQVSIRSADAGEAGPREILVRTLLSGVSSGTELALYRGTINTLHNPRWGYWSEYPISPGYELVGVVEECGDDAVADVGVGDRVVCHAPHGTQATVGYQNCIRVPDAVSNEEASMAMLGATTAHGIRRAQLAYGEWVLVLGYGAVGLLSAEHARRAGARRVFVADPVADRRTFAEQRGFVAFDPTSPTLEDEVLEATEGRGVDVVIEASGHPVAVDEALRAVRRGGRILLQGTITERVEIAFSDVPMHKEVTFVSTWGKGPTREGDRAWTRKENQELAMELIARGELRVSDVPRRRFRFEETATAYEALDRGEVTAVQVVLDYQP